MSLAANYVLLKGIEVTRAGQKGHLGRYPIHFHMAGNMAGKAFVEDNSIHHNFQRCLTVHGTDGLQIWRNVAYKTRGHCFFMEDGPEKDNYFAWNLAMHPENVRSSEYLTSPDGSVVLKFDSDASCFWVTNPINSTLSSPLSSLPPCLLSPPSLSVSSLLRVS